MTALFRDSVRNASRGDTLTIRTGADSLIDFGYVADIAEGLQLAATELAAAGEIFNLSYGEARTLFDLVSILQGHFADLRYDIAPADGATRPSRGPLDVSKARQVLGYRPAIGPEVEIAHCVDYLRGLTGVRTSAFSAPEE